MQLTPRQVVGYGAAIGVVSVLSAVSAGVVAFFTVGGVTGLIRRVRSR